MLTQAAAIAIRRIERVYAWTSPEIPPTLHLAEPPAKRVVTFRNTDYMAIALTISKKSPVIQEPAVRTWALLRLWENLGGIGMSLKVKFQFAAIIVKITACFDDSVA